MSKEKKAGLLQWLYWHWVSVADKFLIHVKQQAENYSLIFLEICACWGNIFILCVLLGRPAGGVSIAIEACGLAHLRGWWMCWLMCWTEGSLGTQGCGFWWATCAAAGVKSLSPFVTTPDTIMGTFGGLVLTYSSSSSSFCGGSGAAVAWCFWTILIPPAFTATHTHVHTGTHR